MCLVYNFHFFLCMFTFCCILAKKIIVAVSGIIYQYMLKNIFFQFGLLKNVVGVVFRPLCHPCSAMKFVTTYKLNCGFLSNAIIGLKVVFNLELSIYIDSTTASSVMRYLSTRDS